MNHQAVKSWLKMIPLQCFSGLKWKDGGSTDPLLPSRLPSSWAQCFFEKGEKIARQLRRLHWRVGSFLETHDTLKEGPSWMSKSEHQCFLVFLYAAFCPTNSSGVDASVVFKPELKVSGTGMPIEEMQDRAGDDPHLWDWGCTVAGQCARSTLGFAGVALTHLAGPGSTCRIDYMACKPSWASFLLVTRYWRSGILQIAARDM